MNDDELFAQLAFAAPAMEPPAGLRSRLLDHLPRQGYHIMRAGEGGWTPFAAPGIYRRQLGEGTFLLKIDAGAVLPAHPHPHTEHCYVIEGELFDDEHTLGPGDYEVRYPGSAHAPVSSKGGAIVLIVGE